MDNPTIIKYMLLQVLAVEWNWLAQHEVMFHYEFLL